jgi:hypothetical protein
LTQGKGMGDKVIGINDLSFKEINRYWVSQIGNRVGCPQLQAFKMERIGIKRNHPVVIVDPVKGNDCPEASNLKRIRDRFGILSSL